MVKTISILLCGGALALTVSTAVTQVQQEEFTVINPTSKAKLWATVFYPANAGADEQYPAVVFVPGGLGFGSNVARSPQPNALARAGFVVGYFDPDGRGRSEGQENWNGKVHQDGLHAFLKHVAELPQVRKDNLGVFSSSLGLAMVAGALGRYPDDPPVKYFIDDEGPSDRFYITKRDTPRFLSIFAGHTTKEEDWWAEREAVRTIQNVRCAYLRIQRERDHVHGEDKQHALDMINAATPARFGGKGKCSWTRINGAENEANRIYTKDNPPKWLAARAGPPLPAEMLRWIQEMAARGEKRQSGDQPRTPPRTKAICVVHCDPVPESAFEANWALLEELVATADRLGAKLSLHFTGSYAALAWRAAKAETVRRWLGNGHGAGAHPHPEYAEEDKWLPQMPWTAFPQAKVEQAMQQTTDAVNRLVGAENNLVLDTLFPFYTAPASFPEQYTHFAWGNHGHSELVPVMLPSGRTLTAVFYRTLPGDPIDPFHLTAEQMAAEFRTCAGTEYGPVLHPADFRGAGKRELTAWFRWLQENRVVSTRVSALRVQQGELANETLRVGCEVAPSEGNRTVVVVGLENRGKVSTPGMNLTAYLPTDYSQVALEDVTPKPTRHDLDRPRLLWRDQTVGPASTVTYTISLTRRVPLVNHPISAVLDVYLEGQGITPRWSFLTLAGTPEQGWYLPFASFNPGGRAITAAKRSESTPPFADRASADRIRRELHARPTNMANAGDRLALLLTWAQAFLGAGRQAELDTVLPPEKFRSLQTQIEAGATDRAATEIDQALIDLANLLIRP